MWSIQEVRRLVVEGAETGYNPSAIRVTDDLILIAYRVSIAPANSPGQDFVECAFLNEDLRQQSPRVRLDLNSDGCEDPRLARIGNQVCLVYGIPMWDGSDWRQRRLAIAHLEVDETGLAVRVIDSSPLPPVKPGVKCEKNWTPFQYNNDLLLSYCLIPHTVVKRRGQGEWELLGETSRPIIWPSTYISGGTPAIKLPQADEYLGFFHAVSFPFDRLRDTECDELRFLSHSRYYTFGAYTFASTPPFKLLKASPHPLTFEGMLNVPNTRMSRDERVLFPGGLLIDGEYSLLFIGENDSAMKAIRFQTDSLLKSLVPIRDNPCHPVHERPVPC
jgi:predicted GH43/DUF377 family glycosyl hydrolase